MRDGAVKARVVVLRVGIDDVRAEDAAVAKGKTGALSRHHTPMIAEVQGRVYPSFLVIQLG